MNLISRLVIPTGLLMAAAPLISADNPPAAEAAEFFEKQVRPVFARSCVSCHGPSQQFSELRLDSEEGLRKGGKRGAVVIAGDPKASLLARAVRHEGLKMPVGVKLADAEIAAIEKWIAMGAPWPKQSASSMKPGSAALYEKISREHWAFQPVTEPKIPSVQDAAWSNQPVDRFLLASMEKAGLRPAGPAVRRALIRRLSLVLTGLPPTPLEAGIFERDTSPSAYEKLVDRLLASPHFGEHWARHWMDIVRFAETFGNDWNYELHGAAHYRDYLIRAFNRDVPFDQLVREHVAGDLLEKPRLNPADGLNESEIGLAFLRFGEQGHDDCIRFRQIRTDVVDNQIDTLGKAFQGLTIACARCHDHKLDPIPTADYYALYGVLTSSRLVTRSPDLPGLHDATKRQLREMKPKIRAELASVWLREADHIPRYLLAANRAWKGEAPAAEDAADLSLERVQSWLALLEKQKPAMEDPLYPFVQLQGASPDWKALGVRYKAEAQERAAFNRDTFRPLGEVTRGSAGGWSPEGSVLLDGPSPSGEFAVASSGVEAVSGVLPAGVYTHAISERLQGSLRSPLVPKDKKFVSLQIMGGKLGARRTILDNCMLSEDYETLDQRNLKWVKIPNRDDQPDFPFFLELVTKANNPRIPDRPGRLKATPEQVNAPNSYFGIARAVVHDADTTPKDELSHMTPLFAGAPPAGSAQLAERYAAITRAALRNWASGKASDDDARWIGWLLENKLLTNSMNASPALRGLIADYRLAESRITEPRVVYGVADLDKGYNFPILPGGDATHPGKLVPRGFLQIVARSVGAEAAAKSNGSGRREVAEMIASPKNPLTARVAVNRIWQHVFGKGIVATSDNFGVYGERPSHPELLDFLASRFVAGGWSFKKQIRELVLSRAFQQSSQTVPEAAASDPLNRLLSHYPVRRMEAESIRDSMLAVSGRLDRTLYGPSINPHREEPKDYRRLFQGPLDGDGRRSLYTKVTRHEGSRFLETFDFPIPSTARGTRDTTNVPPQALALLNDPFVLDQAGVWADRLIALDAPTPEARIESMFLQALGRPPDGAERERFAGLTRELASLKKVEPEKLMSHRDLWKDVAHAVFNLKEFVYIR